MKQATQRSAQESSQPLTPIKKGQFSTVAEMLCALSEDKPQAELTIKRMAERRIIDFLVARRLLLSLSQQDLAKRMGCTQSRISKLERSKDADLRIGDLNAYAAALDLDVSFRLTKHQGVTVVDQVKQHVFAVQRLLRRLVELAEHDKTIADGTQAFFAEVILNSVKVVAEASEQLTRNLDSASKNGLLTNLPNEPEPTIQEAENTGDDSTTARMPLRRALVGAS